jgi:hypothetical protein
LTFSFYQPVTGVAEGAHTKDVAKPPPPLPTHLSGRLIGKITIYRVKIGIITMMIGRKQYTVLNVHITTMTERSGGLQ